MSNKFHFPIAACLYPLTNWTKLTQLTRLFQKFNKPAVTMVWVPGSVLWDFAEEVT